MRFVVALLVVVLSAVETINAAGTCKTCKPFINDTLCAPSFDGEAGTTGCTEQETEDPSRTCTEWQFTTWGMYRLYSGECPSACLNPDQFPCDARCIERVTVPCYKTTCLQNSGFCVGASDMPDEGPESPLVVKLLRGPWQISAGVDGVHFDMNGDGGTRRYAWPASGSGIAFLVMDRDGDGVITSGRELFGDNTLLRPGGATADNGFEALRKLDSNRDGRISAGDRSFGSLRLWRDDSPRDGASQEVELLTLTSAGVEWISVDYHTTGRADANGNMFSFMALAKFSAGYVEPIYDVVLQAAPIE